VHLLRNGQGWSTPHEIGRFGLGGSIIDNQKISPPAAPAESL